MKALIRYLFPPRSAKERLPLLPLDWSSEDSRHAIPDHLQDDIWRLQAHGLARTKADAHRILKRYQGQPLEAVVKAEKRKRRRQGMFKRAWQRLKRIW